MDEYKIDSTMEKVGEIANELVWISQVLEEAENVGRNYFGGGQLQTPNEGVTAIRNFRLIQETAVETLDLLGDFENHRLLDDSGISLRMLLDDLKQDDSRAKFGPLQAGKINQAVDIIRKAFDRAFRSCGSDLKKLSASIRVARGRDEFRLKVVGAPVEEPVKAVNGPTMAASQEAADHSANIAETIPAEALKKPASKKREKRGAPRSDDVSKRRKYVLSFDQDVSAKFIADKLRGEFPKITPAIVRQDRKRPSKPRTKTAHKKRT